MGQFFHRKSLDIYLLSQLKIHRYGSVFKKIIKMCKKSLKMGTLFVKLSIGNSYGFYVASGRP